MLLIIFTSKLVQKMSLTPDLSKKVGLGIAPSPNPFLTPRPERRRTDPRMVDWNSNRQDRDKETNVQVLLRCRWVFNVFFFFFFVVLCLGFI